MYVNRATTAGIHLIAPSLLDFDHRLQQGLVMADSGKAEACPLEKR
jgi:hypothetical protein